MNQAQAVLLLALTAGLAGGAGALGHWWWTRRLAKARRRIPAHWPLQPRRITNAREREVWHWLMRVFFDHCVMIKMPVTRFTFPRANEDSAHWYQLLSGVYGTFTICRPDGQVVGCVDVPGRDGISRSNRLLKLSLLSQCGIAYRVIRPTELPTLAAIRADFLGDAPGVPRQREAAVISAHQRLRSAVERQRQQRRSGGSAGSEAPSSEFGAGGQGENSAPSSGWHQPNSFMAPVDSELRRVG